MQSDIKRIVDFRTEIEAVCSAISAERRIEGELQQSLWTRFTDSSGQMVSGTWECTEGKWLADYSARSEFCHIVSGKVVLTNEAGTASTFAAGDSFVIPMGFMGTWEVLEKARKLFVTVTPQKS